MTTLLDRINLVNESASKMSLEQFIVTPDSAVIYESEYGDEAEDREYTKAELIKLCEGNIKVAHRLYVLCNWQHPATLLDEDSYEENESDQCFPELSMHVAKLSAVPA